MLAGVYIGTTGKLYNKYLYSGTAATGANFTVGTGNFTASDSQLTQLVADLFTASTGRGFNRAYLHTYERNFTATSDSTFLAGNVILNAAGINPSPAIFLHNNGTVVSIAQLTEA